MDDDNYTHLASSNILTIVDVKDLRIGMYIAKLDRPWLESNFLFQGFELKTQSDINAVKKQCQYVYVETQKANKSSKITASNTPYSKGWLESRTPPDKGSSFEKEIANAGNVYNETSNLIKTFMDEVRIGNTIKGASNNPKFAPPWIGTSIFFANLKT